MSMSGPLPCLLLLAAGRSRRLGRPKGGLVARGVPLLVQQLQKARAAGIERALVVLGAGAPRLEKLLTPTLVRQLGFRELRICHASAWREGMGGSLRDGLRALPTDWKRVLVLLVDQTGVQGEDLRRLAALTHRGPGQGPRQGQEQRQLQGKVIATIAKPGGSPMAPVVLPRNRMQDALRHLQGDRGLGPWLRQQQSSDVVLVPCPAAAEDLDTPAAAAAWRAQRRQR
jgi:nicotine blue oxidoreductase